MRRTTVLVERFIILDGSFMGTSATRMVSAIYHDCHTHTGSSDFASSGARMCRSSRDPGVESTNEVPLESEEHDDGDR